MPGRLYSEAGVACASQLLNHGRPSQLHDRESLVQRCAEKGKGRSLPRFDRSCHLGAHCVRTFGIAQLVSPASSGASALQGSIGPRPSAKRPACD